MEAVEIFKDELQSILDTRPPVSKAKMVQITRAAMKSVKYYKHVVMSVERFIAKSRSEYKIPGLYVIDSIVRQSRHQYGKERDVFGPRFARNMQITFDNLFSGCTTEDKPRIVRVLNLWQKNGVFNSLVIQPLLDLANPRSAVSLVDSASISSASNQNELNESGNNNTHFKFSKNVLDFDYGEDDDDEADETPTEAEPPLSSTLSKIEMEQRRGNIDTSSKHNYQQMQQISSSQQTNIPISQPRTNEPDPVLERWNRIIRQQNIASPVASNSTPTTSHTSSKSASTSYPRDRHQPSSHQDPPLPPKESFTPQPPTPPPGSPPPLPPPISQTSLPNPPPGPQNSNQSSSEREAERKRKCFPKIKDRHVTVCSSTLWLGHVPKTVSEAEISDAFGEFGTIESIDLIPPRGCAYVCMDRRQDAKRALSESKGLKLNGSHIKIAWAPGKGLKEYKNLKEFFELDIGCAYIPYGKIDSSIDLDVLEEGGVIDEDSMSNSMRESREKKAKEVANSIQPSQIDVPAPSLPILSQPPPFTLPPANLSVPPPLTGWVRSQSMAQGSGIGGIPFPPPPITTSSTTNIHPPQIPPMYESKDIDSDGLTSPNTIEKHLSMTEQQINMVEQQLNLIQQAQGLAPTTSIPPVPSLSSLTSLPLTVVPPPSFQPNPLIFDLPPPPIGRPQQMSIFANPAILAQPPPMLPSGQGNLNPNMEGAQLHHYGGGF